MAPKGNVIRRNVLVRSGRIDEDVETDAREHAVIEDNLHTDDDPGFVDAAARDYQLRDDSRVWTEIPDFEMIRFEPIGLQPDEFRPELWPHFDDDDD
jgi:hypothetical protein